MKTPHAQIRIYTDSTFSIDFYEDYKNVNYINELLEAITSIKRNIEIKISHAELCSTPFYFTKCSNCGFYVLTNRDQGYKIDCQNCNYKDKTRAVDDPKLNNLLDKIHKALGKSLENLKGQVLILLIQPNYPERAGEISKLCENFGFKKIDEKNPAILTLFMEGLQRQMLVPNKQLLPFKMTCEENIIAYSNETPPVIAKLVREIRIIDPETNSLSMNFNPQDDDLPHLLIQEKFDEAEDVLRKELQVDPSNVENLAMLSWLLESKGQLNEAKEKILLAQGIDPGNSYVWSQLGAVQEKLGNCRDAIKAYEQAIKIDPLYITPMLQMITCYHKMGRLDLASKIEAKLRSLGGMF